jgi:uncharacterized protein
MSEQTSIDRSAGAEALGISEELIRILVCPVDHAALEVAGNGLRCTECQRVYPVSDGIPSMVPDSATQ